MIKSFSMGAMLAMLSMSTLAAEPIPYTGGNIMFPDETSTGGLPEAFPCNIHKFYTGANGLFCTWLANARHVDIFDQQQGKVLRYINHVNGACNRGICRTKQGPVGEWKDNMQFSLSIWYYIGSSTDGKPVAYRIDRGPKTGNKAVSYAEAGTMLHEYYLDSGLPDSYVKKSFNQTYQGGMAQWENDKSNVQEAANTQSEWPDVKSAWCNPRADDDCYINEKKVPIADLGKWLPPVSQSQVDQLGGYCETYICFDTKDQPLGVMQ